MATIGAGLAPPPPASPPPLSSRRPVQDTSISLAGGPGSEMQHLPLRLPFSSPLSSKPSGILISAVNSSSPNGPPFRPRLHQAASRTGKPPLHSKFSVPTASNTRRISFSRHTTPVVVPRPRMTHKSEPLHFSSPTLPWLPQPRSPHPLHHHSW